MILILHTMCVQTLGHNFHLNLGKSFSAKQWFKKSLCDSYLMELFFRRLSFSAIFSFCLFVYDVNPEKGVSIASFSPISMLIEICSTNIVGAVSSRFLLA